MCRVSILSCWSNKISIQDFGHFRSGVLILRNTFKASPDFECKCNDSCFSISNSATMEYQLKLKEAPQVKWLQPNLKVQKQYRFINLVL